MAISASDELKIFENTVAMSPLGMNDPDLVGKFTRAKQTLHMMSSMQAVQAMQPPVAPQSPINTMPQQGMEPQIQSTPQMEGNGTLTLPQ